MDQGTPGQRDFGALLVTEDHRVRGDGREEEEHPDGLARQAVPGSDRKDGRVVQAHQDLGALPVHQADQDFREIPAGLDLLAFQVDV